MQKGIYCLFDEFMYDPTQQIPSNLAKSSTIPTNRRLTLFPPENLRPLPQQRHQRRSNKHTNNHKRQPPRTPRQLRIEQEIPGKQLHQSRIDEYPRRDGIQHARNHIRRKTATIIRRPQAQPYRNRNRRRETVSGTQEPRQPMQPFWKRDRRHASTDTEAFEGLVEHENGIQSAEFGTGDAEVQTDDYGVEHYAEFEDEEGGDLLAEGALFHLVDGG